MSRMQNTENTRDTGHTDHVPITLWATKTTDLTIIASSQLQLASSYRKRAQGEWNTSLLIIIIPSKSDIVKGQVRKR